MCAFPALAAAGGAYGGRGAQGVEDEPGGGRVLNVLRGLPPGRGARPAETLGALLMSWKTPARDRRAWKGPRRKAAPPYPARDAGRRPPVHGSVVPAGSPEGRAAAQAASIIRKISSSAASGSAASRASE